MKLIYTGDFERLKDFGFREYYDNFSRTNGTKERITVILKNNRKMFDVYCGDTFEDMKVYDIAFGIDDLIQSGLVKKEDE